jgi:hypothetical protein
MQPRDPALERYHAASAIDRNHSADHLGCLHRRVAPEFRVTPNLQCADATILNHTHHAVRQEASGRAEQQHVAMHDVRRGDRPGRDRLAVTNRRVHAGAVGPEPDRHLAREGVLHNGVEKPRRPRAH